MHRLSSDCLVRLKMSGVCRMSSHAAWMRGKRSASVSTVVSYTKVLRCPQMKKSNGLRSGDVPATPLDYCSQSISLGMHCSDDCALKWAGTPSCMYHMLWWTRRGTSLNYCDRVLTPVKRLGRTCTWHCNVNKHGGSMRALRADRQMNAVWRSVAHKQTIRITKETFPNTWFLNILTTFVT
jgi:hypothetical protein